MRVKITGTILSVLLLATSLMSQATSDKIERDFPTRTLSEFADSVPGYCWYNQIVLDQISQHIPSDLTLIVIARLGAKERRTEMNKRRLHNIRVYLTEGVGEGFGRSADSIVVAEGERTTGRGRIEFYIQGRLINVLIPHGDHDLSVTGCYDSVDGGEWCSTKWQKQFYPCKDRPTTKNMKRRLKRKK